MLIELIQAFASGNASGIKIILASFLLSIPIFILALSVHETAHGIVANKLGDPTAKSMGRLTLNPLKHIDPLGFLAMLVFGFGWAKPVPINTRYFKKPKRDMALTAAAGPLSNIILAIIFAALYKIFSLAVGSVSITSALVFNLLTFTEILLYNGIYLNVVFAVFNLLPVPPLDGSRLLFVILPSKLYFKIQRYENYIMIAFYVLLALGVVTPVINFFSKYLMLLIRAVFRL